MLNQNTNQSNRGLKSFGLIKHDTYSCIPNRPITRAFKKQMNPFDALIYDNLSLPNNNQNTKIHTLPPPPPLPTVNKKFTDLSISDKDIKKLTKIVTNRFPIGNAKTYLSSKNMEPFLRVSSGYFPNMNDQWDWTNMYISDYRCITNITKNYNNGKGFDKQTYKAKINKILEEKVNFAYYYRYFSKDNYRMNKYNFDKYIICIGKKINELSKV